VCHTVWLRGLFGSLLMSVGHHILLFNNSGWAHLPLTSLTNVSCLLNVLQKHLEACDVAWCDVVCRVSRVYLQASLVPAYGVGKVTFLRNLEQPCKDAVQLYRDCTAVCRAVNLTHRCETVQLL
jgi:hypothetical protein